MSLLHRIPMILFWLSSSQFIVLILFNSIGTKNTVVNAGYAEEFGDESLLDSTCAYGFTVCPKPDGSDEGVDFRSHFVIYAATHNLSGWVRNGCDKCVHGMFASFGDCDDAHEFVDVLTDESKILIELDSNAAGLESTIVNITGYPNNPEVMCPGTGKVLPDGYVSESRAYVDWSFSNDNCTTPCECMPTSESVIDCADTSPLPPNATFTLECQRYPLGADASHFPDCNSIYTYDGASCFKIENGTIMSSGECTNGDGTEYGWVNDTSAAQCCGPWDDSYEYGRKGIYPSPSDTCGTYGPNNRFSQKCDPPSASSSTAANTTTANITTVEMDDEDTAEAMEKEEENNVTAIIDGTSSSGEADNYTYTPYLNTDNVTSPCAYGFTVCSSSASGGDEGVDFRSHFAIYGATHNLSGWVRNSCNKCVYGMFASLDGNCTNAYEFVDNLNDPEALLTTLDNRASGLDITIENITGYPNGPDGMCENGLLLPDGFVEEKYPVVDWVFSSDGCTSPCDCLPQAPYVDCAESGTGYSNCREWPLGTEIEHFPDCNTIYHHDGAPCWFIEDGNITSSGLCDPGGDPNNFDWVNDTHAAMCCGPYDVNNEYGRTGIYPMPEPNCSAYGSDNPLETDPYMDHCIQPGNPGFIDEGRLNATIEDETTEVEKENEDANLDEVEQEDSESDEKADEEKEDGEESSASALLLSFQSFATAASSIAGIIIVVVFDAML